MASSTDNTSGPATDPPLPADWTIRPADDLRTRTGGRILIGGAPLKIIRLSATGGELARSWFAGAPIGPAAAHQKLARRLIRAGMANPEPARAIEAASEEAVEPAVAPVLDDVTVVIPVHDDAEGVHRTVSALLADGDGLRILVMDDGSPEPVIIDHPSVRVERNETKTGPGAARQRALPHVETRCVAFVDAGVVVSSADLTALAVVMADRGIVAVAPRVVSRPDEHLVGRYDRRRSPLDLGPVESLVGPGRMVPYVPTACVVVRSDALIGIGGFDPELRYGEDVDLIWRLGPTGDVRYLPSVTVTHPPRRSLTAMIAQRRGYGSAAAPLAARHGDAVAPCGFSPWSALVIGLFVTGHPIIGAGVATGTGLALRSKIAPLPDLTIEALGLTFRGHWHAGLSVLNALARTWSPVALCAAVLVKSQRRRIGGLLLLAFARRLLDGPRSPRAAAEDVLVGAVDDLAYASGVWRGVVRLRSVRSLLPALNAWPKPSNR